MDEGVLSAPGFSGITDPMVWTFATRSQPPAPKKRRLVVSADNRGDFCSVQGAIDFVPAGNATPFAIDVKPGTYNEIVYVPPTKPFVTVSGLDRDSTIIQVREQRQFQRGAGSKRPGTFRQLLHPAAHPRHADLWNCWRALFGSRRPTSRSGISLCTTPRRTAARRLKRSVETMTAFCWIG